MNLSPSDIDAIATAVVQKMAAMYELGPSRKEATWEEKLEARKIAQQFLADRAAGKKGSLLTRGRSK